jgi:hypothetical protein
MARAWRAQDSNLPSQPKPEPPRRCPYITMPKGNDKTTSTLWICGEASSKHPKHSHTWVHGLVAYLLGHLCSVGLGIYVVDHQWITNTPETISPQHDVLGYGLFLYQLAMVVCRAYVKGPEELYNQLWACNAGMALATTGILLHKPIFVGAAIGVVAIDQMLWYFDCIFKVTTGSFKIGVAKYLEWPETPMVQKIFSWHHLWFLPLCIYYLRATGPGMPQGALKLSILGVFSMTLITRLVTPKDLNVNMAYQFWQDIKIDALHCMDGAPVWQYIPYLLFIYNCINLPLWPFLTWCVGRGERVTG